MSHRADYLQGLYLSSNFLSGSLPDSVGNLQSLTHLELSRCEFTGPIPSTIQINVFTGLISSIHLESLSNVVWMYLSENSVSGTIPISLFALPSLGELDLSGNRFSGEVAEFAVVNHLSILDLSSNRLEGPIPTSSLLNLKNLQYLNLSVNRFFNDSFHLEKILNLPKLKYLELSSNNLSLDDSTTMSKSPAAVKHFFEVSCPLHSYREYGMRICLIIACPDYFQPPFYSSMGTELVFLDLSSNNLSGRIPDCLFENVEYLTVLNLGRNRISGHIPNTVTIYSCLQSLDLRVYNLVGDVPLSLANSTMLEVLNLSGNNMTGPIPNFTAHCSLQYLVLNNNNFIGEVPQSLGNCKQLELMNVGNNHIEGSFPCMLPSSLHVLVLRSNRFHGEFTCRKNQNWPNLQIVDIASNNFSSYLNPFNFSTWRGMTKDSVTKLRYKNLGFAATGWLLGYYREEVTLTIKGIERKLVKIWPDFTSIDFSNNNFHGGIPDSIGGLDALYLLNLSHNSLTGTIPKSIGKLRQLGALDLSANRLIGEIPEEITGLTFLQLMNVSHNELVGKIPVSTQIQSFPADCFEGNLGLCGLPLNNSCSNPHPVPPPPPQGNEEIEWEYVFVAAGYAVGLGIFSWVLLFCRSFRYKYFEKIDDFFDKIVYRHLQNKRRDRRRRRAVRNEVRRL